MKASEVVTQLQGLIYEHGDLDVGDEGGDLLQKVIYYNGECHENEIYEGAVIVLEF